MSPRRRNPDNRATLIDAAARLVAEGGPGSLSARLLAREAGTSTMAVYTYFGSMSAIVREIVHDGFGRPEYTSSVTSGCIAESVLN